VLGAGAGLLAVTAGVDRIPLLLGAVDPRLHVSRGGDRRRPAWWYWALGLTGWGLAVVYIGYVRPPDIDSAGAYLAGSRLAGVTAAVLRPSWVSHQRSWVRRDRGCGRSHACAHTQRVRNARRRGDLRGSARCGRCPQRGWRRLPDGPRGIALAGAGLSAGGPLTVPRSSRRAGTRRPQTRTGRRARGAAGARPPADRGWRVP